MLSKRLLFASSLATLALVFAACGEPAGETEPTGGTSGAGGAGATGGASGASAGKPSAGGASGSAGVATGGAGGRVGTGGASAGTSTTGGAGGSVGGAASGAGGTLGGAGGVGGSVGGAGGAPPQAGAGGSTVGGAGGVATGGSGGRAAGGSAGAAPQAGAGGSGGTGGGSESGMPVPPTTGVAKPSGAAGGLKVLDWAGFKGAYSYTFDDTNSSQISNYDALQALGVPFSFYLITGKTSDFNSAVWPKAVLDGHEIGNHSKSHGQTGSQSDVDASDADLRSKLGIIPYTFAAPMGDTSWAAPAKTKYFINRGVNDKLIGAGTADSTDAFNLPCWIPNGNAPVTDFDSHLNGAHSGGKWQVVLVHGFTGGSDGAYNAVSLDVFKQAVNNSKAMPDMWLDTVMAVGSYWLGQKKVAAATPATSGSDQVYTWTLPDHFPPGRFVRVTFTGGTPSQGGTPLTWDDHGYYEVALDTKSLTLSP